MHNQPLVSVLIPLYNSEKYIGETIESVLNQNYKNIEIIIVDDGSTDNSYAFAKNYESKGNIKIFQKKNGGVSTARNLAYKKSKGEWIQYLDADDILSEDKISSQILLINQFGNDNLYCCDWGKFYKNKEKNIGANQRATRNNCKSIEWIQKFWNNEVDAIISTWLIPRKIINKAGIWNENLIINEDAVYFCNIFKLNVNIIFCDKGYVYYRQGIDNSISNINSRLKINGHLASLDLITKIFIDNITTLSFRNALVKMYATNFFRFYSTHKKLSLQYVDRIIMLKKHGEIELNNFWGPKLAIIKHIIGIKNTFILEAEIRKAHRSK